MTVPVKCKSCELKTPPVVKCREVLREALHPFKPAQRHLGRYPPPGEVSATWGGVSLYFGN